MVSNFSCRKTVLLLLVAFLAAPWASAASDPSEKPGGVTVHGRARQDLLSRTLGFLASLWSKEGSHIDPDGRDLPQAAPPLPTPQVDEGCRIDPDGFCRL